MYIFIRISILCEMKCQKSQNNYLIPTHYMEIDSKSFHEFGKFIEETEYRALMNQKAALSQKPESVEINFDVSDLLPF